MKEKLTRSLPLNSSYWGGGSSSWGWEDRKRKQRPGSFLSPLLRSTFFFRYTFKIQDKAKSEAIVPRPVHPGGQLSWLPQAESWQGRPLATPALPFSPPPVPQGQSGRGSAEGPAPPSSPVVCNIPHFHPQGMWGGRPEKVRVPQSSSASLALLGRQRQQSWERGREVPHPCRSASVWRML